MRWRERHAVFSAAVFVLVLCMLPSVLIVFWRHPLFAATLLVACAAHILVSAWYLRSRRPSDGPELYAVPILADDPAACLAACEAELISEDAQGLFAMDGRLHARVLALECDDFDASG